MERRTYLLTLGATAATATAGCLGGVFGSDSGSGATVLSPPEDQVAESQDLAYPAYGQSFPEFELPDATSDAVIDTASLETPALATAFFASCPAECGILLDHLAEIQRETIDRGLTEEITFLPITFDPARDDAEKLRENADRVGADLEAGNWHNLRPDDAEEAEEIVTGQLGVTYERTDDSDRMEGYDFTHIVVTWLVNREGVVERVYRGEFLDREQVLEDVETLLEGSDGSE
ncbi:MAG: SCO family protein [Natrialbaceae archaeon]